MKIGEAILLLAGLAGLVAGNGHLRGVRRETARRLATSGTYKVFFFEGDGSKETQTCSETLERLIDEDYGLEVVRLGEEPLDPVILHEFTVCNETFVEESLEHDHFIYMEDNSAPTHFCVDKLLDAYDEGELVDVAFTALFIYDTSCEDEDSIDELLEEVDYSLLKEESYDQLVTDILDYYVEPEEEEEEEPLFRDSSWYRAWRKRRSRHKRRHRRHERHHPKRFHRGSYKKPSGHHKRRYHDHRKGSDRPRHPTTTEPTRTTTSTPPPPATITTRAKAQKTTTSTQPPVQPQTSTQPPLTTPAATPSAPPAATTQSPATTAAPTTTRVKAVKTTTAAPAPAQAATPKPSTDNGQKKGEKNGKDKQNGKRDANEEKAQKKPEADK